MKKLILLFISLFTVFWSWGQNTNCDFYIKSSFNSECILTNFGKRPSAEHDQSDCQTACKGSRVTYTIENLTFGWTHDWAVSGTDNYLIGYNSIIVTWPDDIDEATITLISTNYDSEVCVEELCINLIDKPNAGIESNPIQTEIIGNTKHIYVCNGQVINLYDNSFSDPDAPIVGYYWYDGINTYADENITITADGSVYGNWIKLKHTVVNECGCEDWVYYEVHISKYPTLSVDCYGTACEGSEVTYTANNQCDTYYWSVEGGDITAGQQTSSVTVNWNDVENGYGYIALDGSCHGNLCPYLTYLPIPVIQNEVDISGPEIVCQGDIVYYELPQFASTEYNWEITPSTGINVMQSGARHKYMVEFNQLGTYTISADYDNSFLECGGAANDLSVLVKEAVGITGDVSVCAGETESYSLSIPFILATWKLYDENMNLIASQFGHTVNFTFPDEGAYVITADNSNFCRTAQISIIAHALPISPSPDVSNWENQVCLGSGYLYQAEPEDELYYLSWNSPSSTPDVFDGNDFTALFQTQVSDIELFHIDRTTGCKSEPFVFPVSEYQAQTINWPNPAVCKNTEHTFTVPYEEQVDYHWTVFPPIAGGIVGDAYSNNVTVMVNDFDGNFSLKLSRTYCGDTHDEDLLVSTLDDLIPELNLGTVCQNESVTISPSNTSTIAGDWVFTIEGTNYSFSNLQASQVSFTHTFSQAGTVPIQISFSLPGCAGENTVVTTVQVEPAPDVTVNKFLNGTTGLWELTAISQANSSAYTYLWSTGETSQIIAVLPPTGQQCNSYSVTVTNPAGCSDVASETICSNDNQPLPTCDCPTCNIDVDIDCNQGDFQATMFNNLAPITWSINNPNDLIATGSTWNSLSVEFLAPGYYVVSAKQVYDDCDYVAIQNFDVPLIAKMNVNAMCNNSGGGRSCT